VNVDEVLGRLLLRFTSGNDVPVDRALITRREFDVLVRSMPRPRQTTEEA
jgi:hypothetical protein